MRGGGRRIVTKISRTSAGRFGCDAAMAAMAVAADAADLAFGADVADATARADAADVTATSATRSRSSFRVASRATDAGSVSWLCSEPRSPPLC